MGTLTAVVRVAVPRMWLRGAIIRGACTSTSPSPSPTISLKPSPSASSCPASATASSSSVSDSIVVSRTEFSSWLDVPPALAAHRASEVIAAAGLVVGSAAAAELVALGAVYHVSAEHRALPPDPSFRPRAGAAYVHRSAKPRRLQRDETCSAGDALRVYPHPIRFEAVGGLGAAVDPASWRRRILLETAELILLEKVR